MSKFGVFKGVLIIATIFVGFFIFKNTAFGYASDAFWQDYQSYGAADVGGGLQIRQFQASGNYTMTGFRLKTANPVCSGSCTTIYYELHADSANTMGSTLASGSVLASSLSVNTITSFLFSTPYNVVSGTKYWFRIYTDKFSSGYGTNFKAGATAQDTCSGRAWWDTSHWDYDISAGWDSGLGRMEILKQPTASISVVYPVNGSTYQNDFYSWAVNLTPVSSVGYNVWLDYGTTTSFGTSDVGSFVFFNNTTATTTIKKSEILLPNTAYYVRARLQEALTGTNVATSSTINFQMGSNVVYGQFAFSSYDSIATTTYSTSTRMVILTCDSGDYFCNIMAWFLNPKTDFTYVMSDISDLIKKKPPIGYFTLINSLLTNTIAATSTAAYSLADLSGLTTIWTPLNVILTAMLWLLFGFWVIKKISSLNL